jgi:hypothetical protein
VREKKNSSEKDSYGEYDDEKFRVHAQGQFSSILTRNHCLNQFPEGPSQNILQLGLSPGTYYNLIYGAGTLPQIPVKKT